jgi:predicted nucleotidyltransferase
MVALSTIQELAGRIAKEFNPERIVLFGSYANGTAKPDSDVDLLVVLPFEGKSFWKSLEIANLVDPPFAMDLLARRPDDTAKRYALGDPLIKGALDQGKVLYERNSARVDSQS